MTSHSARGTAPGAASEELAALGPFFAVEVRGAAAGAEAMAAAAGWRPMAELVGGCGGCGDVADACGRDVGSGCAGDYDLAGGSDALAERVAAVRAFLASGTGREASAVELRVAASVVHLGLVARVVSPLLALAVLHRRCGRVRAADLWWQPTLGSMFPLAVREAALDAEPSLLGGAVAEFGSAIARFGVSEHIVRGNIASALAGAGKTLAAARPDLRDSVNSLVRDLLAGPYLAGAGAFETDGAFRRRSCCLIYRAAPAAPAAATPATTPAATPAADRKAALCGDCILAAPHGPMDT